MSAGAAQRAAVEASTLETMSAEAFQTHVAAMVRAYAARLEGGEALLPLAAGEEAPSATEVMTFASQLLKAADLQVFELGLWQSWTGQ